MNRIRHHHLNQDSTFQELQNARQDWIIEFGARVSNWMKILENEPTELTLNTPGRRDVPYWSIEIPDGEGTSILVQMFKIVKGFLPHLKEYEVLYSINVVYNGNRTIHYTNSNNRNDQEEKDTTRNYIIPGRYFYVIDQFFANMEHDHQVELNKQFEAERQEWLKTLLVGVHID